MNMKAVVVLLAVAGIASPASACGFLGLFCKEDKKCPPRGFDSVDNFDLDRYISEPWYVQEQMPLRYQPEDQLFCVRAVYDYIDPQEKSKGVVVYNYANEKKVNGKARGTNGSGGQGSAFSALRAFVPDASQPSKLEVGPNFFQEIFGRRIAQVFYGPYWVVALDPNYEWAIISGGAPTIETEKGCIPGMKFFSRFNGKGFWLFSRKPVDPESTAIMRQKAEEMGFDTSVLLNVEQEGCKYKGAI
ncbi:hypothetical protein BSKO_12123 [Bryopsis sp. KO-2023]|nr:hypothetical protein BSKO_12123 [Bryopsis sp. KO-2023]